jgi:hypothetical protein
LVGSEDDDAVLCADEGARLLVEALREHGAASASAARLISGATWHLATRLVPARRGLIRHGAPRALVAAMNAHFDAPDVVESTSAALAAIAVGNVSLSKGVSWGMVAEDEPVVDVPLSPRRGRLEAAGCTAADDFNAALSRA